MASLSIIKNDDLRNRNSFQKKVRCSDNRDVEDEVGASARSFPEVRQVRHSMECETLFYE